MSSLPDNTDTTLRPQTRREALKTVAILAGASVLPHSASAETAARRKRVIVAGGGIGGLCCAFELMERGHDVTVVEASRRTGGRPQNNPGARPPRALPPLGGRRYSY